MPAEEGCAEGDHSERHGSGNQPTQCPFSDKRPGLPPLWFRVNSRYSGAQSLFGTTYGISLSCFRRYLLCRIIIHVLLSGSSAFSVCDSSHYQQPGTQSQREQSGTLPSGGQSWRIRCGCAVELKCGQRCGEQLQKETGQSGGNAGLQQLAQQVAMEVQIAALEQGEGLTVYRQATPTEEKCGGNEGTGGVGQGGNAVGQL